MKYANINIKQKQMPFNLQGVYPDFCFILMLLKLLQIYNGDVQIHKWKYAQFPLWNKGLSRFDYWSNNIKHKWVWLAI